jgi:hypothetical protein
MIPLQPDNGPAATGTTTVPVDAGWAQAPRIAGLMTWVQAQTFVDNICALRRPVIRMEPPLPGEGSIYVVGFCTGTVKVGQSVDPATRVDTHYSKAAAFGVALVGYWVSPAHVDYLENEAKLIDFCAGVSERTRKEYFHKVGYMRAARFASQQLPYRSMRPTGVPCDSVWA